MGIVEDELGLVCEKSPSGSLDNWSSCAAAIARSFDLQLGRRKGTPCADAGSSISRVLVHTSYFIQVATTLQFESNFLHLSAAAKMRDTCGLAHFADVGLHASSPCSAASCKT